MIIEFRLWNLGISAKGRCNWELNRWFS